MHPKKDKRINPFNPIREISVVIPVHKEPKEYIKETVLSFYNERYPIKHIIVCGDSKSELTKKAVEELSSSYLNLYYIQSPYKSKAKKINYLVKRYRETLGEFVYVRDCRVIGNIDCIEKMISYFNDDKVAAVTSYGRVSIPKNFLSKSYFYGKAWINEIGRFRKNAQEKRGALFVICGASTIFRTKILSDFPIPSGTKTEDTGYTWFLQKKGFRIRVADDATVSAPEVDGEGINGIKGQIKQSYRWSSGTIQCMYREGRELFKNKKLVYTTILPGFLESLMYSVPLVLIPILLFIAPVFAIGFIIGDTFFSLIGTLIIIPKKFFKTLVHYPQIVFFKYINSLIFVASLSVVTFQAISGNTKAWANEWNPPRTK